MTLQKIKKTKTEKKKIKLTLPQERFCLLYAGDREFFGNGVQSYMEAYNIDSSKRGAYNSARVSAHYLLTNPNILKRIDELLTEEGLNDVFVDKQLKFTITQCADISSKIRAINEYNKLKGRHKAQKIKFVDENEDLDDSELNEEEERAREEIASIEKTEKYKKKQKDQEKAKST